MRLPNGARTVARRGRHRARAGAGRHDCRPARWGADGTAWGGVPSPGLFDVPVRPGPDTLRELVQQFLEEFAEFAGVESSGEKVATFLKNRSMQGRGSRWVLPSHHLKHEAMNGLASSLHFECGGLHCNAAHVQRRASHGNKHHFKINNSLKTTPKEGERSTNAKYQVINQQAALAMMATGNHGSDLHTIAMHLDIPLSSHFAIIGGSSRGYAASERQIGLGVEAAARASCWRAVQLELKAERYHNGEDEDGGEERGEGAAHPEADGDGEEEEDKCERQQHGHAAKLPHHEDHEQQEHQDDAPDAPRLRRAVELALGEREPPDTGVLAADARRARQP